MGTRRIIMAKKQDWYDFAGQVVGCYTVIEKVAADDDGNMHWRCKCNVCGNTSDNLRSSDLSGSSKKTKNCSMECRAREAASQYIGKRYHMLTVTGINEEKSRRWKTLFVDTMCDCGNLREGVKLTDLNCKDKEWACSQACAKKHANQNYIGYRSGKLEVVGVRHGKVNESDAGHGRVLFDVVCECGTKTTYHKRNVLGDRGCVRVNSCGCEKAQRMQDICKDKWDGHTPIPQARATNEYFAWRKAVYKRYSGTCAACGSKNRKGMEAHHLYGFSFYQHLKYDENNGILLCEGCHKDFHRKHGNHFNVPQQMLAYMGRTDLPGIDLERLLQAGEPTLDGPLEEAPQVDTDIGEGVVLD